MFHYTSQRTNQRFKPKFLRLLSLKRKSKLNLDVSLDEDFTLNFYPKGK